MQSTDFTVFFFAVLFYQTMKSHTKSGLFQYVRAIDWQQFRWVYRVSFVAFVELNSAWARIGLLRFATRIDCGEALKQNEAVDVKSTKQKWTQAQNDGEHALWMRDCGHATMIRTLVTAKNKHNLIVNYDRHWSHDNVCIAAFQLPIGYRTRAANDRSIKNPVSYHSLKGVCCCCLYQTVKQSNELRKVNRSKSEKNQIIMQQNRQLNRVKMYAELPTTESWLLPAACSAIFKLSCAWMRLEMTGEALHNATESAQFTV